MSLAALKKNRMSDINKLVAAAEKVGGNAGQQQQSYEDNRFWKPEVDKAGNGYAVLRFLPAPEGEDLPWTRYWDHGFQGPGGWYIEKSLTSIGQNDPVGEVNTKLWNSGLDSDKEIARKQKRRLHYVANVLVVSDPAHPENEGRVFLYQFGKKIFDKMMDVMQPQFQDEEPINPFDLWEGANFKLKIRNVEGYRNYDKSEFADKSGFLDGDDTKLENVYSQEYSLKDFTDKKLFKEYGQLKARLDKVLGFEGEVATRVRAEDIDIPVSRPAEKSVDISADDDLDYFKSLAED